MHTKSLGTDSTLVGSCLLFLAKEVLPGTVDANFLFIWEAVQKFYKENRTQCRLSKLTQTMVKNEPFPKLSAKAVETRDLLPALEFFLRAWLGVNPLVVWFHRLVAISCRLDTLVFSNKTMWLSEVERLALRKGVFEYNQTLSRLALHFHRQGKAYCNFTIKNHYLLHVGLSSAKTGINPRLAFCYQGEDFMSVLKTLVAGSHRGVESAKLIDKVVPKYVRGLDLLLQHG